MINAAINVTNSTPITEAKTYRMDRVDLFFIFVLISFSISQSVLLHWHGHFPFFFTGMIHQHETTATAINAAIGQKPPSAVARK